MHVCAIAVVRRGLRGVRGLNCHQPCSGKHLSNFNDDDHVMATQPFLRAYQCLLGITL